MIWDTLEEFIVECLEEFGAIRAGGISHFSGEFTFDLEVMTEALGGALGFSRHTISGNLRNLKGRCEHIGP